MTFDELKTLLNELPHTRFENPITNAIVDKINKAAVKAGFADIGDYIEMMVRSEREEVDRTRSVTLGEAD